MKFKKCVKFYYRMLDSLKNQLYKLNYLLDNSIVLHNRNTRIK